MKSISRCQGTSAANGEINGTSFFLAETHWLLSTTEEKNFSRKTHSYWQKLSDVLLLINDWFDVLNSQSKFGSYIKKKYSSDLFIPEYIITRWLCQDVLENFFSYLRAIGAANDHPSPVEVQHRLKWYILGEKTFYTVHIGTREYRR